MLKEFFYRIVRYPQYLMVRPNKKVAVFVHLPKCGGTTVSSIMRNSYNPWSILDYYVSEGRRAPNGTALSFCTESSDNIREIRSILSKKQNRINCVLGHIPYGIHNFIDRECQYLTFVREPVKRVWSQFNHILRNKRHYLHPILAKYNFDLAEVLVSGEVFEFVNDQSRMLLGSSKLHLDDRDICDVIKNVDEQFFFVAPLESYNNSMAELCQLMNWRYRCSKRENIGVYKRIGQAPTDELARLISKYNFADQALYEHVLHKQKIANLF